MQAGNLIDTRSRALQWGLAMTLAAAMLPAAAPAQPIVQAAHPARGPTLERIRADGKIVLGYYTDVVPMSYRDPSGNAAGYSVALCQKVVDEVKATLGLQRLALQWVPLTPATSLQQVQQGKIDLLCGSDAASLAHRANVSFSLPVFPGGVSALLRADAPKALRNVLEERPVPYRPVWRASPFSPIQNKTLSVVAGTPAVAWGKERASKLGLVATLDTVDSYETGLAKVADRRSDILFGDRAILLALARRSPDAGKLRVLPRHFTYEPLALAMARNDDDFRLVVDRALAGFYASPAFGDAYTAVFGPADGDTIEFFRSLPR